MEDNDVSLPRGAHSSSTVMPACTAGSCADLFTCPAATLTKLVKDHLPAEMRCASDAMDMLMECCTGVGPLALWCALLQQRRQQLCWLSERSSCTWVGALLPAPAAACRRTPHTAARLMRGTLAPRRARVSPTVLLYRGCPHQQHYVTVLGCARIPTDAAAAGPRLAALGQVDADLC